MSTFHKPSDIKPDSVPNSEETTEYFFREAIEAENLARDIYVQYAQMFFHVPDVSSFWQGMAYDEAKHAHTLKKALASLTAEKLAAPADQKFLGIMMNMISLLNTASQKAIETLDDAYEIAHELEFSELNYIFKCVAGDFMTQEEGEQFVVSGIDEHQKKLVDFKENFGDRNWRRQILPRSVSPVSSD
ncbi:ferritin family protein [Planctomycetota bacterium]